MLEMLDIMYVRHRVHWQKIVCLYFRILAFQDTKRIRSTATSDLQVFISLSILLIFFCYCLFSLLFFISVTVVCLWRFKNNCNKAFVPFSVTNTLSRKVKVSKWQIAFHKTHKVVVTLKLVVTSEVATVYLFINT